ncbi:acyltransferase [Microbacterium sp. Marseille-Q6965]|uniref:acyltransferase family protein n=1 Tax=Microbacterium sp. Marseille-Q6965 TaxID=2965072 RepID=UPI0021B8150D|nr:acyltransferase [Microbacterium sp. Marseille-Q6965]
MTAVAPAPLLTPRATTPAAPARDRSLDLLRAGCTVLVVLLHAMMVGVTVVDGAPVFANALETVWFAPVSWFVQMMPLFFLAGGATGLGAWRRARARGVTAGTFAASRVQRLIAPALTVMMVMGGGLLALTVAGVPADIVATAGFRMSQPLWFLGVFVLVQALVPAMTALHERRPVWGIAGPLLAVIAIDMARLATGIEAIGFLGLAAVWLLVQQLGFLLADGRLEELSRDARLGMAAAALGLLLLLTMVGPYSPDMYVNLNPPTLALVLLGTVQLSLFSLAQPALRRLAQAPPVGRAVDAIGERSMTIYLWHMPVLIGLAGLGAALSLLGALPLPALGSPEWWSTRAAWLAVAGLAVAGVVAAAERLPRPRASAPAVGLRAAAAAALGVVSIAVVFVLGLSWPVAVLSAGLMALALRLASRAGENPRRGSGAGRMAHGPRPAHAGVIPAADADPTRD